MTLKIRGSVSGNVMFPEHPEHVGDGGLVGGEDVYAERRTFRSLGEAMTWCRKVLDGKVNPRWDAHGELLEPRTDVRWSTGRVYAEWGAYGEESRTWETDGRDWRELNENTNTYGDVVRSDP